MKKEKQICDFGIKKFNKKKRTGVELASRPTEHKGKPSKGGTTPPPPVIPPATKVIYLEFYGAYVQGTMWNTNGPIDAAHSGLTEDGVADVIAKIKAHFANYNVIVTNDIQLYNSTPNNLKTRVIFTESYEWFGSSAGGVAYLNSFGWADQSPAWVFTTLLSYSSHSIGEAGAHEIGHTTGCRHQSTCRDGVIISQYNWGDGITAPVMGASYNVPSGDWWVGPTPLGCAAIQNDTQILEAKLGLK